MRVEGGKILNEASIFSLAMKQQVTPCEEIKIRHFVKQRPL
jgi:hypothetical protein